MNSAMAPTMAALRSRLALLPSVLGRQQQQQQQQQP
jgi:hypothetical protein